MDWTSAATLPGTPHAMAMLAMARLGAPFHAGLGAACGWEWGRTNRFAFPARAGSQLRRTNLTRLSCYLVQSEQRMLNVRKAINALCPPLPAAGFAKQLDAGPFVFRRIV